MQTNNKIKSVWKKLRFSYKLTIFNEHTLEQVVMLRISRLTVILSILIAVILIGGLTTYLITRTPLRRTLPGYISPEMRRQIVDNAISVDSLSRIVNINKAYLDNLSNIISGNIPLDSVDINNEQLLHTYSIDSLLPASNATNSFLRKYAEIYTRRFQPKRSRQPNFLPSGQRSDNTDFQPSEENLRHTHHTAAPIARSDRTRRDCHRHLFQCRRRICHRSTTQ